MRRRNEDLMLHRLEIPERIDETRRLGRHVFHDDRSWLFPAPMAADLRTVQHRRHYTTFNQGDIGMCTGVTAVEMLMTAPFWVRGSRFGLDNARSIYSAASRIDRVRGVFPPDDVGSSGLAVMKVLKRRRLISEYRHAFGLRQALRALVLAPVGLGINWYEGFDKPRRNGECRLGGDVRGGHEIIADGLDVERKRVWCTQSWGTDWGPEGGRCFFTFDTLEQLLDEDGDVITASAKRPRTPARSPRH